MKFLSNVRLRGRVSFAVLIAFLIAFSIFSIILMLYHYSTKQITEFSFRLISRDTRFLMEEKFYTQNFDSNAIKIFILGSSQVQDLNATRMNEFVTSSNFHNIIYDLGIAGDVPSYRLKTVNMIISAKPNLVIYGVSDRDFLSYSSNDYSVKKILPDPHNIFAELFSKIFGTHDISFLQSPKLDILKFIQKHMDSSKVIPKIDNLTQTEHYQNTPFLNFTKEHHLIATDEDLKKYAQNEQKIWYIPPPDKNDNVIALIKMIDGFHKNNIKVVILVTPVQRYHLDRMPEAEKESFDLVLKKISDATHVPIYYFYDRYADLPIFQDTLHVAFNPNSTIYSDDVTKIILKELEH